MKVTIKELADMAGVHRSTVDKVLHKRPGVSEEVRSRIQRMIDELGYESNPLGKALNYQRNKVIIVAILLEVDALAEIRDGIEQAYKDFKNFNIEIQYEVVKYPDADEQARRLLMLKDKGISGVIVSPLNHPKVRQAIDVLADSGIPVVTTNADVEGSKRICFIGQDLKKAGAVAARLMSLFLNNRGRVAIVIGSSSGLLSMVAGREIGFREYLAQNEPAIEVVEVIETQEDSVITLKKTAELLRNRSELDGIFITCGCVPEVCSAVKAANRNEIKIVSFERYRQIEALLQSGVISCTISSDLTAQGYQALKVLFEYFMYDRQPEQEQLHMAIGILLKENL